MQGWFMKIWYLPKILEIYKTSLKRQFFASECCYIAKADPFWEASHPNKAPPLVRIIRSALDSAVFRACDIALDRQDSTLDARVIVWLNPLDFRQVLF